MGIAFQMSHSLPHSVRYGMYVDSTRIQKSRAQLFETNDAVSSHIVKTLIIKYGIYANIFAEKM